MSDRILTLIPYTGDEKLVAMTENCVSQLSKCEESDRLDVFTLNNGASRAASEMDLDLGDNTGFGKAINTGIDVCLKDEHSHVLVMNNDLEFPDRTWLARLLEEIEPPFVLSPLTDNTANPASRDDRPYDLPAIRVHQVSAFCWLVPVRVIKAIRPRFGFHLFDPDFFAYGEDDYTGAILRKLYGKTPFKVVRRSWVKHLKGKTGAALGLRGGMKRNLDLLKSKMRANRLR